MNKIKYIIIKVIKKIGLLINLYVIRPYEPDREREMLAIGNFVVKSTIFIKFY